MGQYDDLTSPEWPEILRSLQKKTQAKIHTSQVGKVVSYDSATQVASVQIVVQLDGEEIPQLDDVPVLWPGGAKGFLHVPLQSGDLVMVLFAEEDFSAFWDTGSVSPPKVLQRHGLHAVAIPGFRREKAPYATTSGHVTLAAADELRLGSDAASVYVALANLVDARLETIRTTWIMNTAMGPTSTFAAAGMTALASVASSKVKSE